MDAFKCVNKRQFSLFCMRDPGTHIIFPYETGLTKLIRDVPGAPADAADNVRRTEGTKSPIIH